MKTKKKKRNYAAADATLINIRALKKRVEMLETQASEISSIFINNFGYHANSFTLKKRGKK